MLLLLAVTFAHYSSNNTATAAAGINHQINFQGKLVNPNGTNVTDGTYSIVFSMYNVASAGTAQWTETQSVTVSSGIFQVNLGSVTTLPGAVDFNSDNVYLGIKVGADAEMSPRILFTSVPQAFNSEKLGGLDKSGFIQNSTTQQASTNFNISGNGTAGTSFTTPLLQSAPATALTITANAASVWSTSAGNLTIQAAGANTLNLDTGGAGTVAIGNTATIVNVGNNTSNVTLNLATNNGGNDAVNILTGTGANVLTVGNASGATSSQFYGNTTFTQQAGKQLSVTTGTTVPTVDQLAISNAGSTGVTTAGVNGLSINYKGGAAAVESSAQRIDLQPGTTSGGTWSGLRFVAAAAGPAAGVVENGIKLEGPTTGGAGTYSALNVSNLATTTGGTANGLNVTATNAQTAGTINGININALTAGAATENAINIGAGWDNILQSTNFSVTGAGALTAAGAITAGNNLYVGNTSNQRVSITGGATNHGLEVGRTDGTASTPFLDFHSGTTGANDYDSRIVASGGTASSGGGTLSLQAATTAISGVATVGSTLTVSGVATFNSDIVVNGIATIRGYATTNTSSTFSGQYTKLADCTIVSQYSDCHAIATIVSIGDGNATGSRATVDFRVKQQAVLGGAPIVNVQVTDVNGNITASNFVAVTTTNDATSTVVGLYGQISSTFQQWKVAPTLTSGSGANPVWYANQGFAAALPAGAQNIASYYDLVANTANANTIQTSGTTRITATGVLQNVTNADASTFFSGGTLGVARGGTNATTVGAAGSVAYSTGTAYAFGTVGVANQCLLSGGAGAPTWGACSPTTGTSLMTLQGDTGGGQGVLTGDTITIAGGTNIATVSGVTDKVTINVVNNPTFSGLVTTQAGINNSSAGITSTGALSGVTTLAATGTVSTSSTVSGSQLISTVATGTAPLQVASTTMVANLNAQLLGGYTDLQITTLARSGQMVTGGGTVGYNSPGTGVSWTTRFIVISNSRGADFSTSGYFDIAMPVDGTVIAGANTADITVAGGAIPLGTWCSLYYVLPIGQNNTSLPANFRTVCYSGTNFSIPSNWLLIASHNSENNTMRFANGLVLRAGQTGTSGTTNNVTFNTSVSTPLVQNAGVLNVSATGANQINFNTNGVLRWSVLSTGEFQGAGNINTTAGAIQTNSVTRITAAGVLQNVTNADASTFFSAGTIPNARLVGSGALSVNPGIGLTGGGSIALGAAATIGLANTAVTAGTYGSATTTGQFTVDAQGRITGATNVAISGVNSCTTCVSLQATTTGTAQTGNINISGSIVAGGKLSTSGDITTNGNALNDTFIDAQGTNLVANGSFEKDTAGWSPNVSTLVRSTTNGYFGSSSMQLTYSGSGDGYVVYPLPMPATGLAGRPYTLSFWAKGSAAGTATGSMFLQGLTPSVTLCSVGTLNLTTTWQKYKVTCTIPTNVTSTTWRIALRPINNSAIDTFFDGINVQYGTSATEYTPITTNDNGNVNLYDGSLGIGTTSPSQKLDVQGGNINTSGIYYGNGKNAIQTNDTYLRLNNSSEFTSGVYTPGALRLDGALNVYSGNLTTGTAGTIRLTNAGALTNITGYSQISGSSSFNQNAADQFKVTALQAPTTDMVNISNAGFPVTSDGINGLQTDYYSALGVAAYQASAQRINVTNTSSVAGSTTNALRIVASGAVAGTTNGIKIDNFTSGAGGASALYVGTGWKDILSYNGTQLINGSGVVQSAAISGSYGNLTGTGTLTSGSIATGFGTISTASTIQGTTVNGTTGINTGASGGTQRIDASGNLLNINNISSTGVVSGNNILPYQFSSWEAGNNNDAVTTYGSNAAQLSSVTVSTGGAYDGTRSLQMVSNASGADAYAYITPSGAVPVRPNTKYALSVYVKDITGAGSTSSVDFFVRMNNSATTHAAASGTAVDTGWTRLSGTFTTTADTTALTLRSDINAASRTVLFDGMMLEEIPTSQTGPSGYSPSMALPGMALTSGTSNITLDGSINTQGVLTAGITRITATGVLQNVTNADASTFFTAGTIPNARLTGSGALTVTAGTGLTGGGSIALGGSSTVSLANTAVAAGTYGSATSVAQFTVDAQGRITSASSVALSATCSTCVSLQATTPGAAQTGHINVSGTIMGSSLASSGTLTVAGALTANSTALFKNGTNSTSALQIQNASSQSLFNVDTTNSVIAINQSSLNITGAPGSNFVPSAPTISQGATTGGSIVSGTTYYYKVTAVTGSGESSPSNESSFRSSTIMSPPATAITTTPTNGTPGGTSGALYYTYVTATGETTPSPAGDVNVDSSGNFTMSNISTGPAGTIARKIYVYDSNEPFYTGLYYQRYVVNNNTATTLSSASQNGDGTTPPASGSALSSSNILNLSWSAVTGATSYKVYRGTAAGAENILLTTTATTTYNDTGSAGSAATIPGQLGTPSLQIAGATWLQTTQNTTNAFKVQNASSEILLNADTVNQRISVGASIPASTARLTVSASINSKLTWTIRTASSSQSWTAVAYGNGRFVATAAYGSIMSSTDGVTWTAGTTINAGSDVIYANGMFVAVGNGYIYTSPDGVTWTSRANGGGYWQSITYGNGRFVAVGTTYTGLEQQVTYSTDGINWTGGTSANTSQWAGVAYGNGTFVAVASTGTNGIMTSTNGASWTARTEPQDNNWQSITYGNGVFVAVASTGTNRVMTSVDGITWTSRTGMDPNQWSTVTYANGMFVAVSTDGAYRAAASLDGITWYATQSTVTSQATWMGVTYGNGVFVAVANTGTGNSLVMTSGDSGFGTAIDAQGDLKISGSASVAGNITTNGAIQIGGFISSTAKLTIQTSASLSQNGIYISSTGTGAGTGVVVDVAPANPVTSYFFLGRSNNGADNEFFVRGDGVVAADGAFYGASYNSGSADVAEYVPSSEAATIEAGDVLEVDGTSDTSLVKKSTGVPYASKLAGVVSTDPGVTLGDTKFSEADAGDHSKEVRIALTGRVPVKVTDENGAIHPGDYITSSSTPGYGMKATQPGMTIGRALASFNGETGTVLVLVENSYYNPSVANILQAGNDASFNDLTVMGTADIANLNVSGNTTLHGLTVKGDATIEGKLTVASIEVGTITISGHLVTKGDAPQLSALSALGSKGSVSIDGNDTAGTITVTTGDTGLAAGDLGKVIFKNAFGKAPRIVLSAQDQASQSAQIFPTNKTAADFVLKTGLTLPPHTTYTFDYIMIE